MNIKISNETKEHLTTILYLLMIIIFSAFLLYLLNVWHGWYIETTCDEYEEIFQVDTRYYSHDCFVYDEETKKWENLVKHITVCQ